MYVSIFYHKPAKGGYGGRAYTYQTALPLRPGDHVWAPTADGKKRALVVAVNLPETEIDEAWRHKIKSITELCSEEVEADA